MDDIEEARLFQETVAKVKAELAKAIVGQDEVVDKVLLCVFSAGHAALVGVPGLAKTLLVRSLGEVMDLSFSRVQFTPDLMPSDITGTDILQEDPESGRRRLEFIKGPLFANIVLADEINRTPPKTQAALLEAMQEHRVTVTGRSYRLPSPFFVLATQNPIEQEGTYPLPEAQLDRFMFMLKVGYPSEAEELRIVQGTTGEPMPALNKVIDGPTILRFQELLRKTPVPQHVYEYAVRLVRRTRPDAPDAPRHVKSWVNWGAGPRAGQCLILGAKAAALSKGNFLVGVDDVREVAEAVLTHRVLTNFHAESEGVGASEIVGMLLKEV